MGFMNNNFDSLGLAAMFLAEHAWEDDMLGMPEEVQEGLNEHKGAFRTEEELRSYVDELRKKA